MDNGGMGDGASDRRPILTKRELQVLAALARFGNVSDIADSLSISPSTVETHLSHIRAKSGLHHAAQIVAWGYDNGFLSAPD